METAAPNASPPRTRSLKLTISFIAFLAVLPLLVGVAYRNFKESGEKEQERLWLVGRSNARDTVAAWFDMEYRSALLASHAARRGNDASLQTPALAGALAEAFPANAAKLGLADAVLYWHPPSAKDAVVVMLARVGNLDVDPDADVLGVLESGIQREVRRSGFGTSEIHAFAVVATLPLTSGGKVLGVVRLMLPEKTWTSQGQACANSLAAWFEETRTRLIAENFDHAVRKALQEPLPDPERLKASLDISVEKLRESLHVNGLAIFWAVPSQDDKGRVLGQWPWLRSGTALQAPTDQDREALRTGEPPRPGAKDDPSVVIVPLTGNVPFTDPDGKVVTKQGIVAVAHFSLPSPPHRGDESRFLLILMIAIMALVLGFLFFYMNQAISQPIQRLIGAMTRGTKGELQPIAQGGASGEVAQLALIYNSMVQENRKLMDQIRGFNEQLKNKVRMATGELERRNDELRRANEKLFGLQRELSEQQRLASMGQLAGTMAHELGTPLNAMSGHIELLLAEPGAPPEEVSKRLNLIGSQIERLSGIIQSNLQELRAPAPRFVTVDLNTLAQGIVSLVTPSVAARKVSIRTSLATDLPRVAGDPGQLEQVLMNLVNNALDAMPGGGSLDLLTANRDGMACLQVRDSGNGISREDIRRVFDPFFTTKVPGKGTGLGLAICREIVKAHGGSIDVQSEPGKGSWFTVKFPAAEKLDGSGFGKAAETPAPQPAAKLP
ncbi:MAG: ATP-binding protein [Planctomycetota bacterium]